MQAYTELLPPSAVTHAVYLSFVSPSSTNLIVAKTSLLQIFHVVSLIQQDETISPNGDESSSHTRLVLVGEYPVAGTVTSLASVKALNTKSGADALLVASRDAKISLVEWDPETYSLSTVSIHFYEGEQLQGSPWTPDLGHWPCYLTVEPSSRCAALKFGQRHIAILPFRQIGDDLVMDEDDHDLGELDDQPTKQDHQVNGEQRRHKTPYSASFVLPLTALDPAIIYPRDVAFLYEYREPTLGVLSSSIGGAASMLRKDVMTYTAFTLDLEQKARTPLLSVSGLPSDLFQMIPLPLPVGGALLVGANELVHVDQAGKTHGIGVNEFSRVASSFSMTDHSQLALHLEGCVITPLSSGNGDLLLCLSSGNLAILGFRMDGRSVSGLNITPVPSARGGNVLSAAASCAVPLQPGNIFLGSEDADAIVISFTYNTGPTIRKRSQADGLDVDADDSDEDLDDEDDLYGNDSKPFKQASAGPSYAINSEDVHFTVQDRLLNLAPSAELAISRGVAGSAGKQSSSITNGTDLKLGLPVGRGEASALLVLKRSLNSKEQQSLNIADVHRVWTARLRAAVPNNSEPLPLPKYDSFLIASHVSLEGQESSSIYKITDTGPERLDTSDFEADIATFDIAVMNAGSRLVQVSKGELRCYDPALDFPQIIPMTDEETDAELKVTHSSFLDRYALVVRDDSSVCVLHMDEKGELEELDKTDLLLTSKWSSGCLYHAAETDEAFMALLSIEDSIHFFQLPDLETPMAVFDGFPHLPPYISKDYSRRRLAARINLRDIFLTTFGNASSNAPHLILRTSNDDVIVYQAFQYPQASKPSSLTANIRWRKVHNIYAPIDAVEENASTSASRMKSLRFRDGSEVVVIPGHNTQWITKGASSSVTAAVLQVSDLLDHCIVQTPSHYNGLVLVQSDGSISLAQTPKEFSCGPSGWLVQRLHVGHDIDGVAFHEPSDLIVVGTNSNTDFHLVEDDWHPEWAKEGEVNFKPHVARGAVRLLHPNSGNFIDDVTLLPNEAVLCLRVLPLEVSEYTSERKLMVAVGTAVVLGEDNVTNGAIYIFEIVSVVPDPDRPETKFKLKQIVREDVRGAVTAISEIGNQGFLLHAQGQKCMVRGLKEDQSLLPVVFMDVQCYVSVIKSLKGTGLALMGDAVKGLWLTGYSPEPYKMQLFGKSRARLDVLSADFLPDSKQLFMVVADATCNLLVFEFNPEDPKSLSGQRLLLRSIFHTGHLSRSVDLLPTSFAAARGNSANDADADDSAMDIDAEHSITAGRGPEYQVLVTAGSGSVALVTPLAESVYRRLGALQTHLTNVLDHPCGLNPRAYRAAVAASSASSSAADASEAGSSRGVLDGALLQRWGELTVQRRQEALSRAGIEAWELKGDIAVLRGSGL